ncbi:MAG: tetratricopeptide repeat protein [Balneolaceae bacterium]
MSLTQRQKSFIKKSWPGKSAGRIAEILKVTEKEVENYIQEIENQPGSGRQKLFTAIAISLPFFFFILLEAGLRLGEYRGNTHLFVDANVPDYDYLIPNSNFTSRYFFYTRTTPSPSQDLFFQTKPDNGFRVFVLGGSTAAAYPYGFNGTFSRIVRDALQDVMPDRVVEVVNVATSAINTFTLYDQVGEILDHSPDAILIYSGHNEYYGALGVASNEKLGGFPGFVRFYLKLQRFKTFLLFRDAITGVSRFFADKSGVAADPNATLMERIVGEQSVPLHSKLYDLGKRQFESNLKVIVKKFENKGIPVLIGSLASNLKDHPPFLSVETDIHPPADTIYRQAGKLYSERKYDMALENYIYARDLDALKFRAPSEFNEIIENITGSTNAIYVPVNETLTRYTRDGIIGNDLMLEHLHPNQTGYWLMGLSFVHTLRDLNFFGMASAPENLQNDRDYLERMYFTEFDHRIADHRIRILKSGWPFVKDGSRRDGEFRINPESIADSLAFMMVANEINWDKAKVELGRFYTETGQIDKALAEYHGLIRNQPWNDSPYVFAARLYLDQNDFDNAKPLLEKAYEINPRLAFTSKMLGAVEVNDGNLDRGIELLEYSLSLQPDDVQALFNLSGAYGLKGDFTKARHLLNQLMAINPDFPGARQWQLQLEQLSGD